MNPFISFHIPKIANSFFSGLANISVHADNCFFFLLLFAFFLPLKTARNGYNVNPPFTSISYAVNYTIDLQVQGWACKGDLDK